MLQPRDLGTCVLCGREMHASDEVVRARELGTSVHNACYERESGATPRRYGGWRDETRAAS